MTAPRDVEAFAEVRNAIAGFVCNVSNLPEPLQAPALGLNMGPFIDALTAHVLASPALAALVARERAEALREAADAWTQGAWSDAMLPKPPPSANLVIAYSNRMGEWLRDRADQITTTTEGGE